MLSFYSTSALKSEKELPWLVVPQQSWGCVYTNVLAEIRSAVMKQTSPPSHLLWDVSHHPSATEHMHQVLLGRISTGGHVPGAHLMCFDRQSVHRTGLALVWSDLIWCHFHYNAFTGFNVSSLVWWLHGKICCFSILLAILYRTPTCENSPLPTPLFQMVFQDEESFKIPCPIGKVKPQSQTIRFHKFSSTESFSSCGEWSPQLPKLQCCS